MFRRIKLTMLKWELSGAIARLNGLLEQEPRMMIMMDRIDLHGATEPDALSQAEIREARIKSAKTHISDLKLKIRQLS